MCVRVNQFAFKKAENKSLRSSPCEAISPGAAQFAASVLTSPCANGILSPEKTSYFRSEVVGRSCN